MKRIRRVGTLTLGLTLMAVGLLYLVCIFLPQPVDLLFAVQFWPLALISLGCEVLYSYWFSKEEKLRYDGGAIFLSICVIGLAWFGATLEMIMRHGSWQDGYWYF